MKTKARIEKQLKKKTNSKLVETIIAAKKNKEWNEVASILSMPRRKRLEVNLDKISKEVKGNETVIIPGKVLSMGEIDKKIKISALYFSNKAKEKLDKADCETLTILEEIKKNPGAKGIKILK
ncbi:50S ribosomal protein L18e [Candidatus Pacearchaeota archaeon]|nr:50S ribosomal protein L18e [Candidatus Pacearchaeota archaeon]